MQQIFINEFKESNALLEGHFILSSGLHSSHYLQSARVLMDPERAQRLCLALAEKIRAAVGQDIDLCVSPAMGGVIVGFETAKHLKISSIFTERVEGKFTFRRGFEIKKDARVVMVEDVITTGLSSRECIAAIEEQGGHVVAVACLIDRSCGKAHFNVPMVSLITLDIPSFAPDQIPESLAKIPAIKPGSRGLKA